MTISHFVHLSDLHYRPEWPEECDLVCERLLRDLAMQAQTLGDKAYLIFSGDLVAAGDDELAHGSFLQRFDERLGEIGFPKARRITVPGNHDVERKCVQTLLPVHQGTLAQIGGESHFNEQLRTIAPIIFDEKFTRYRQTESRFADFSCCQTALGGEGWMTTDGVGIYALNSALCSYGGLKNNTGETISDHGRLMVETRRLHQWLANTVAKKRILVMHHPTNWMIDWAKDELERIIESSFDIVFTGHEHKTSALFTESNAGRTVRIAAPALFTRKSELLGYSIVSVDPEDDKIQITYRQWTSAQTFVSGTLFSGTDSGKVMLGGMKSIDFLRSTAQTSDSTAEILKAEFDAAIACYSSKPGLWVDRDLAVVAETSRKKEDVEFESASELARNLRSCVIRAPSQFGLTCLGKFLAMEASRSSENHGLMVMLEAGDLGVSDNTVRKAIVRRCKELHASPDDVRGFIIDGFAGNSADGRMFKQLTKAYPEAVKIILFDVDDPNNIQNSLLPDEPNELPNLYLWSLTRARIRELVVAYMQDDSTHEEDVVTTKVVADLNALNTHRTPLNCLLILKWLEQAFDESPVNRTEMIGRVLYALFYQYNDLPRYAIRPDLKDCEFALGYLCEWLIREERRTFSRMEFYEKVQEYCRLHILDFDQDVLFAFLMKENIIVQRSGVLVFRFTYWLYFFAAHRMHHSDAFADYVLQGYRYARMPEIVEFYTGIDRRRTNAVNQLATDLAALNGQFELRTGIAAEFNPLRHATWNPDAKSILEIQSSLDDGILSSHLPKSIKDAIADRDYDHSKPYNQEFAMFLEGSSFPQLVQAMKGAARALRNSDHVAPTAKTALLKEVMNCWIKVFQVIAVLSPLLAKKRRAAFEGMGFVLTEGFHAESEEDRWKGIIISIAENVVRLYQEDIFSKKLGTLLANFAEAHVGELPELFIMLIVARQRPNGWFETLEKFIVQSNKNSFDLSRVQSVLIDEYRTGFVSERVRQQVRRLAAISLAKHTTGSKNPNDKLIEKAAKSLDAKPV